MRTLLIIQSILQSTFNNQQSTNPQPPGLQAAGLQPQQAPSTSSLRRPQNWAMTGRRDDDVSEVWPTPAALLEDNVDELWTRPSEARRTTTNVGRGCPKFAAGRRILDTAVRSSRTADESWIWPSEFRGRPTDLGLGRPESSPTLRNPVVGPTRY